MLRQLPEKILDICPLTLLSRCFLSMQLCVSLARLGRLSRPIATALAAEVTERMPNLAFKSFEPADYVGIAMGFSMAGVAAAPAAAATADIGIPLLAAMAAHLSSGVAGGGSGSGEAASARLPGSGGQWRPENLSQLASAFALAGVKHDGLFLGAIAAAARPQLGQFHAWALDDLKQAYRSLGYSERWLEAAQASR